MSSVIIVHPRFDGVWPWAADHAHLLWAKQGPVEFYRIRHGEDPSVCEVAKNPEEITRLLVLGARITSRCVSKLTHLREVAVCTNGYDFGGHESVALGLRGVKTHAHTSDGCWGQSVAE